MRKIAINFLILTVLLVSCRQEVKNNAATFGYAVYQGMDKWFDKPIDAENQYFNPILSGFYPDPSICRKGDDYFLVNSTFSYFPGVPIFHSKDLVHWKQIGSVLNRESQLNLDGLHLSAHGIYAPAISYNPYNDTFYMITTLVNGMGNFVVKTQDPFVGNWSDPIVLPEVGGIDPSLFFDDDGKAYIVNNDAPEGKSEYDGHRAIWLHEFDPTTDQIVGKSRMIVDGGVDKSTLPMWIEGPHLYKVNGIYYLMCAEGGTGTNHSEVIFTTEDLSQPFVPAKNNPILTQRDLQEERPDKVTSTGHADLIETADGSWYAVFLGCRPYADDLYYTGRETFLLPVTWKDGIPIILEKGKPVPVVVDRPDLENDYESDNYLTGNFVWTDSFADATLQPEWLFIRTPRGKWWRSGNNRLEIEAINRSIYDAVNPAYIGRRIQHQDFEFETQLDFTPRNENELAGVVCIQNEDYNYVFGKTIQDGQICVQLIQTDNGTRQLMASVPVSKTVIKMRVKATSNQLSFYVAENNATWHLVAENLDMSLLTTAKAGAFVGATIGLYASSKGGKE